MEVVCRRVGRVACAALASGARRHGASNALRNTAPCALAATAGHTTRSFSSSSSASASSVPSAAQLSALADAVIADRGAVVHVRDSVTAEQRVEQQRVQQQWWEVCEAAANNAKELPTEQLFAVLEAMLKVADVIRLDDAHERGVFAGCMERMTAGQLNGQQCVTVLRALRELKFQGKSIYFEAVCKQLRNLLLDMPTRGLVEILDHLAALKILGMTNRQLFLVILQVMSSRLESASEAPTAYQLVCIFKAFSKAEVHTEMLRVLFEYILHDIGTETRPCTPQLATHLLFTMLSTKLYSPAAVEKLINISAREHLGTRGETSAELRSLKFIEAFLRLDFPQTYGQLSREALQFLALVRDIRFYDPAMRQKTELSHQLAMFLKKHGFPCKQEMVGPYPVKICDREKRIAFECLEAPHYFPATKKLRFTAETKIRHLEAMGWRVFPVSYREWSELRDYEAKANFVRKLLKKNNLIDGVDPDLKSRETFAKVPVGGVSATVKA